MQAKRKLSFVMELSQKRGGMMTWCCITPHFSVGAVPYQQFLKLFKRRSGV